MVYTYLRADYGNQYYRLVLDMRRKARELPGPPSSWKAEEKIAFLRGFGIDKIFFKKIDGGNLIDIADCDELYLGWAVIQTIEEISWYVREYHRRKKESKEKDRQMKFEFRGEARPPACIDSDIFRDEAIQIHRHLSPK